MRSLAIGAIVAGLAALPLCAQPLDERLPTCFACHGDKGRSQLPETPSLGAQPAFYTTMSAQEPSIGLRAPIVGA